MSLRRHVLRLVVLATAVAVCFSAFAGAASAKKMSAKKKAEIRRSLKKQIKKNPAVIKRKSFVRRASLVNFVLPVTIRLRTACAQGSLEVDGNASSPANAKAGCTALNEKDPTSSVVNNTYTGSGNWANVDLGPSLGQRQIALSGSLAAEVQFNDTYDGGALGNVGIKILPGNKQLTSSSVPLLWNPDVSTTAGTRSDVNFANAAIRANALDGLLGPGGTSSALSGIGAGTQGCKDFVNTGSPGNIAALNGATPGGNYNLLWYGASAPLGATGLPGYPVIDSSLSTTHPSYYLPIWPGLDDPTSVTGGNYSTGSDSGVGPNQNPFPYSNNTAPGSPTYTNASDTVLRTNALSIGIAPQGVTVDGATGTSAPANGGLTNGPQGTQSFITGLSGGQANLFGNIPGKSDSIDVTVNLQTKINSIIRVVDQDVFAAGLVSHNAYPAGIFNCRQIWTGAVQNYIPGVRLKGQLRIAPAITKDGKLRIAKATVQTSQPTHVALSACLQPHRSYEADQNSGTTAHRSVGNVDLANPGSAPVVGDTPTIPTLAEVGADAFTLPGPSTLMKANAAAAPTLTTAAGAPSAVACNSAPTPLIANSGLTGNVATQSSASPANGYSTTSNGSQATVAGDITVPNLSVDVLIGDN